MDHTFPMAKELETNPKSLAPRPSPAGHLGRDGSEPSLDQIKVASRTDAKAIHV